MIGYLLISAGVVLAALAVAFVCDALYRTWDWDWAMSLLASSAWVIVIVGPAAALALSGYLIGVGAGWWSW